MANVTTLRATNALRRIKAALTEFAKQRGLRPGEFQILFRPLEDWGRISAFLIMKDFGGLSEKEMWGLAADHLDEALKKGGDIGFSIGISVRDAKQLEKGGMYAIPEGYVEEELLLTPLPVD